MCQQPDSGSATSLPVQHFFTWLFQIYNRRKANCSELKKFTLKLHHIKLLWNLVVYNVFLILASFCCCCCCQQPWEVCECQSSARQNPKDLLQGHWMNQYNIGFSKLITGSWLWHCQSFHCVDCSPWLVVVGSHTLMQSSSCSELLVWRNHLNEFICLFPSFSC